MFNKDAFIDGGMENEYMISFGPEDCERNDRFKRLKYDVRRVPGTLFHLDHYVGMNSSPANPQFRANHAELEKIRNMTDPELRNYVDHWEWRAKYSTTYYHEISQGSISSAKIVMRLLGMETALILDVGCGVGEWHNDNPNYYGVDYQVRERELLIPKDHYRECNLDKDLPEIDRKYDLVLCLEVVEHIRPHRAPDLVARLCALSDKVLFSAAIPFQGGVGHINEQWQSWWANLFKNNGFGASLKQPDIRGAVGVELWYKNNAILYERGAAGTVTDFVLPQFYIEIVRGCAERK
jgi:SAM-dependent methyltransferase